MIIALKVKNFFSLRDDAVLDFTVDTSSRRKLDALSENTIDFNGDPLVNIIGLFGGNAAGKSNIIKAIAFCRNLIVNSHLSNEGDEFDFLPFKFESDKPSEFYMDFVAEGVEYEYSFSIMNGRIISESLYHYPNRRKAKVFVREIGEKYSYGKGLIARPAEIEANTGPKTLFLTRASSMNRAIPQAVYNFFLNDVMIEVGNIDPKSVTREDFELCRPVLLQAFEVSDSDIIDIRWDETLPGQMRLLSFHKENPSIAFDFEKEESEGTKRLLFILLSLFKNIRRGSAVFLDEFDLKLHLYLAEFILDVVRASRGMQLVFTSHNPMLLDTSKLLPEQIVFVTKQSDGNSEFVPLSDFEGNERIPDVRKAYLQGRFDGVPYMGNIRSLISNAFGKK
ncbi:MAG: ATP-binding protein [Muribaculaceae bacterium]|nr:ATP-binding protein [Muribaculaceae bacterium]